MSRKYLVSAHVRKCGAIGEFVSTTFTVEVAGAPSADKVADAWQKQHGHESGSKCGSGEHFEPMHISRPIPCNF